MGSLNQVTLIGNVGKDPEIRYLQDKPVANFSLATSESYKDRSGQRQDKTEWHTIVAWRHLAETVEKYLRKGHQVSVVGKLTYRSWDKQDGTKGYATEIEARDIVLLKNNAPAGDNAGYSPQQELPSMPAGQPAIMGPAKAEPDIFVPDPEDDLPF